MQIKGSLSFLCYSSHIYHAATGRVYDISIPYSFMYTCRICRLGIVLDILWLVRYLKFIFWTVADILHYVPSKIPDNVPSKVPDIDCSWHFILLYLGKTPIISRYGIIFPDRNFIEPSCWALDSSDSMAFKFTCCRL